MAEHTAQPNTPVRIVILVRGGLVQDVASDAPIDYAVADMDVFDQDGGCLGDVDAPCDPEELASDRSFHDDIREAFSEFQRLPFLDGNPRT